MLSLGFTPTRIAVPYIPVIDRQLQVPGIFSRDDFTYDPRNDSFSCTGGKIADLSRG